MQVVTKINKTHKTTTAEEQEREKAGAHRLDFPNTPLKGREIPSYGWMFILLSVSSPVIVITAPSTWPPPSSATSAHLACSEGQQTEACSPLLQFCNDSRWAPQTYKALSLGWWGPVRGCWGRLSLSEVQKKYF